MEILDILPPKVFCIIFAWLISTYSSVRSSLGPNSLPALPKHGAARTSDLGVCIPFVFEPGTKKPGGAGSEKNPTRT